MRQNSVGTIEDFYVFVLEIACPGISLQSPPIFEWQANRIVLNTANAAY
jgi:hypothetical protein